MACASQPGRVGTREARCLRFGGEQVDRHFAFDLDEPAQLGGSNRFANPQEYLMALNAWMTVGYVAQCAVRGITLIWRSRPRATSISAAFSG